MGWWSDITDAVSEVADEVGGAVTGAVETVTDTVVEAASTVATATDDYVFDTVAWATHDVVNIDFDSGNFGVNLGIDGISSIGVSIGEDGVGFSSDGLIASTDVHIGPDGVSASTSAGIDFGPLPYSEGHVEVTADGEVSVGGHVQGTLPTPIGILSGEATAEVDVTDEGWGASLDADGSLRLPSGTTITGGVAASYVETEDGSMTSVSGHGGVSMPGIGSVGGSAGYTRVEQDGDVLETFHAEGQADVLGVKAAAETDYVHVEADGQSYSDWSGQAAVDGPGSLDYRYSSEDPGASDLDVTGGQAAVVAASAAPAAGGAAGSSAMVDHGLAGSLGPADVADAADGAGMAGGAGTAGTVPAGGDLGLGDTAGAELGLAPAADPTPEPMPDPVIEAPEPPVDSFDASLAAADQVEASVDDLFEGME